ncbi:diguanylate cyclase [Magnetococcus marinus MC-1]|uniref:diguanylate cyclase n=2 Tax=Magnetococcus TaxID=162171 RepID=A0LAY9_MAGMM|nr:diguanylate cyclase [Magnetococcus marinus MC-1]
MFWLQIDWMLAPSEEAHQFLIFNSIMRTIISLVGAWLIYSLRKALQQLEVMATHDKLTGILNRHGFQERGKYIIDQSQRHSWPLAVVMMDIDHFKKINDSFGHDIGDLVLQSLGSELKKSVRSTDIVARLGGEEFALILPNTDSKHAHQIADSIRKKIETSRLSLPDGKFLTYTLSLGVTSGLGIDKMDLLLNQADNALYRAKGTGRNRVVSFHQTAHSC